MADSPALKRDFDHILKHLRDEDYDRCTSAALHFIRTHNGPEAVGFTISRAKSLTLRISPIGCAAISRKTGISTRGLMPAPKSMPTSCGTAAVPRSSSMSKFDGPRKHWTN